MYTYIISYDKNTKRKDPEYSEFYSWLNKQKFKTDITESVYLVKSEKFYSSFVKEISDLFFKDDKLKLLILVEDGLNTENKPVIYQVKDSTKAYIKEYKIIGTK